MQPILQQTGYHSNNWRAPAQKLGRNTQATNLTLSSNLNLRCASALGLRFAPQQPSPPSAALRYSGLRFSDSRTICAVPLEMATGLWPEGKFQDCACPVSANELITGRLFRPVVLKV